MPVTPKPRWYYPWVPIGIAGALAIGLGVLLFGNRGGTSARAAEPTINGAAYQTTDKNVVVSVTLTNANTAKLRGVLRAELLGPKDEIVSSQEIQVSQEESFHPYRFEFPRQNSLEGLKLRCQFGKSELRRELKQVLLAKAHETTLNAGQEYHAGSSASLRCSVQGVKSVTESVPLPGSTVKVWLKDKDGKELQQLYAGVTKEDGVADVRFRLPAVPTGQYKLEVFTSSPLGEEKLEREVKVKADPKILLVTDKPLYQPGQMIHLRALALSSFDLKPVANQKIVFEVEDAKSNKVFKRELPTSEHGIAAIDFQLADEVNTGEYRVRAILGQVQADKSVTVKPYVLPKFKSALTADKKFYMPKEKIEAKLQVDYFFGKPVAGGKVKVTASTFDVAFKEFFTRETKTDDRGFVTFDVPLPDYFVGQPLAKGNALVKIEVKVTDKADHTETITQTYPVSDQAIRVSLIPEAGRLVPGVENRVFAAALYPDGSPAGNCEVKLWAGREAKGDALATIKTGDSGLAEFKFSPKADQFRNAGQQMHDIEILGGKRQVWGPKNVLDLHAKAKDAKGTMAQTTAELTSEPLGENVLLRLDKAVYKGGDTMNVDVLTSAGLPTVYVDFVRNGQTLLTQWLDVKDGKAKHRFTLTPEMSGTLEMHAYQMLASGEIIRDGRVVYVQPADSLNIRIEPDQKEYRPGAEGNIKFVVTDDKGNPAPAALGVIVVDEAVYALQEMQPGLEKVYFTLQEELLKPQAQAVYKPSEGIDTLVRDNELPEAKQQIARALLTAVKPKPPARWEVDPAQERRRLFREKLAAVAWALYQDASTGQPVMEYSDKAKAWQFKEGVIQTAIKRHGLDPAYGTDPFGAVLTPETLVSLEPDCTPDRLARKLTADRIQQMAWSVMWAANNHRGQWFKDGKWNYPDDVLSVAARNQGLNDTWIMDAWGRSLKLMKRDKKIVHHMGGDQLDFHEVVSAGPDGKFDNDDDVRMSDLARLGRFGVVWADQNGGLQQGQFRRDARLLALENEQTLRFKADKEAKNDFRFGRALEEKAGAVPTAAPGGGLPPFAPPKPGEGGAGGPMQDSAIAGSGGKGEGGAAPPRLREYFPETMLWKPILVTDDRGVATMPVKFADSITTWRLTASASSAKGQLGGVTGGIKVFQPFFADLDLPLNLTQNDEVSFPVAVFNYLKVPQKVELTLEKADWFELLDGGNVRTVELPPGEVTGVKFRIRAKRIGHFPLKVTALGDKLSDAMQRVIEIVPDGQKVEQVVTDRLAGKVVKDFTIPDNALPDASKLYVKVYPGVFSQILEGVEGLIRLPGG